MMHEALRLLVWLRFKATIRQLVRGLKTPKGAIIGGVLLLSFGFFCIPLLVSFAMPRPDAFSNTEKLRPLVPILLFAYTLIALFTSLGTDAIGFSPEEVENLFTAPFSRKQLLVYKLQGVFRTSLLSSMFMASATSMFAPNLLRGFIGIYLTILLTILLPMLLTLLAQIGSSQLVNRRRKLAGFALLGLFVFAAFQGTKNAIQTGLRFSNLNQWVASITESAVGSILLAPFKIYGNIIFSTGFDLAFLGNVAIATSITVGLLIIIFRLDANYLAVVERTSFKLAKTQERIRSTGGIGWTTRKEYAGTFPMLPFMNGLGPIVWRQLLVTFRLTKGLILISLLLMGLIAVPILWENQTALEDQKTFPLIAFMGIGYMSMFFSLSAPVGFRPDLHRMEVFKSLPLGNATIAMGQLLGSVLILVLIQTLIISLFAIFTPRLIGIWGIAFVAILPINYLAMAVTNTMCLLLPIKPSVNAKDFTAMGQGILSMFALLITLGILLGTIFGSAAVCFLFTQNWIATVSVGVVLAISFCVTASFALIAAYRRFDVSLNTPV